MKSIAILGGGNLGNALAEGILTNSLVMPDKLWVTRNNIEKSSHLAEKGIRVTSNNQEATRTSEVIILALKPYKIKEVLEEIMPQLTTDKIVVSVATGISLQMIQEIIGKEVPVFRAMPNTAAGVSESMTCLCGNSSKGKDEVQKIFNAIGDTIFIEEELMNAATVIGACGIAYVLRFIRAMIQGGIEIGFDAQTATRIVNYTVKGAAEILIQNKQHPEQEIDRVTTPQGCTIAGLNEMEHQGFSSALIRGIKTSYEKI